MAKRLTHAITTTVALAALSLGAGLALAGEAGTAALPKGGVYKGKVGTFDRIKFKVSGGKVKGLVAGVKTNCQRSSDGVITESKNISTGPKSQDPKAKLKVNKKGVFKATDVLDEKTGVEWSIKGKFKSKTKAKGVFSASKFESVFNPFLPGGFDGQLCSGSGEWKAKLK